MSTNWKKLYENSQVEKPSAECTEYAEVQQIQTRGCPSANGNENHVFRIDPIYPTRRRLVTAEAVRKGHPDKCCDKIADNILDEILRQDPNGRAAIEVMVSRGKVLIAGEVHAKAKVDYRAIAMDTFDSIGYNWKDICRTQNEHLDIEEQINEQSEDIAQAVVNENLKSGIGAGDQSIVVGYATDENDEYMPWPVVIAQRICRYLDDHYRDDPRIGKDGKVLVSMFYRENTPDQVQTIVVSMQHGENVTIQTLRRIAWEAVKASVPDRFMMRRFRVVVNPSGKFVLGGPVADTGLTGRKLAVDQYGPVAHIGGGALSGKDATKVDRSGAYAARWIAKNLVRAGLCRRCEVTLIYVIGQEKPMAVTLNSFGTGEFSDIKLAELITRAFDLRISSVIEQLHLKEPIYGRLAAYGHFGRNDLKLSWEECDMEQAIMEVMLDMQAEEQEKNAALTSGETQLQNEAYDGGGACVKE